MTTQTISKPDLRDVSKEKTLKSWKQWQKEGVAVNLLSQSGFPKNERETSLSFVGNDKYAELTTAHYPWQKRLEELGVKPRIITRFQNTSAEIRYYDNVPIGFIQMPANRGRKK